MLAFPLALLENLVMRSLRVVRCLAIPAVLIATLAAAVSAEDVHYDVFVAASGTSLVIAATTTRPRRQLCQPIRCGYSAERSYRPPAPPP